MCARTGLFVFVIGTHLPPIKRLGDAKLTVYNLRSSVQSASSVCKNSAPAKWYGALQTGGG
ncbi:MAG: hypothetical protein LBR26_13680 [Prevotella sp.]|nr:hypothetical protein [Prevotella sp.]